MTVAETCSIGVLDEVDEFELLQRHPAVQEAFAPQQGVHTEHVDGGQLLGDALRRSAGTFLAAGDHQHGDLVAGRDVFSQGAPAAKFDIVGVGSHREYRSTCHAPCFPFADT